MLLDGQKYPEAAAHCRHILEQYPRHVASYRLLGKALLEMQSLMDAADIFQRILSADPEDFIAHIGQAIIYKEDALYNQALWHMERAFETDPYNPVIRDELVDLTVLRDEKVPDKLDLNQGALARLLVRGEQYERAIAELDRLLQAESNRTDLRVLRAEALWRSGRRIEAVEAADALLADLPNCITANAIVALALLGANRSQAAAPHLALLQEILLWTPPAVDRASLAGQALTRPNAPPLPAEVTIQRLDYAPPAAGEVVESQDSLPDWVEEINLTAPPVTDDSFDYLDDAALSAPPNPSRVPTEPLGSPPRRGALPPWLQEPAGGPPDAPDEPERLADEREAVPDWLSDILTASEDEEAAALGAALAGASGLRDSDSGGNLEAAETAVGADRSPDPVPDADQWLVEDAEPQLAPSQTSPTGLTAELNALLDEDGNPEAPSDDPDAGPVSQETATHGVDLPASLQDSMPVEEQSFAMSDSTEQFPADEFPEEEDAPEGRSQKPDQDALDWLRALADSEDDAGAADDLTGEELPDWLKDDLSGDLSESTLPDWLREDSLTDRELSASPTSHLVPPDEAGAGPTQSAPAEEEPEEDLSWLDAIAAGAEPAIEEPPTVSWDRDSGAEEAPEPAAEDAPEEDEAMAWLEELAGAAEEAPADDALTGPVDSQAEIYTGQPDDPDATMLRQPASETELDDAMAWLERLAADETTPEPAAQAEPKTEVSSEADDVLATESVLDDQDAMAWLDGLGDEDEAAPEDAGAAEPAVAAAEVAPEAGVAPDDAMAWLEELASAEAEDAVGSTPEAVQSGDPDSLDWLDSLAGEAGTESAEAAPVAFDPIDEMPTEPSLPMMPVVDDAALAALLAEEDAPVAAGDADQPAAAPSEAPEPEPELNPYDVLGADELEWMSTEDEPADDVLPATTVLQPAGEEPAATPDEEASPADEDVPAETVSARVEVGGQVVEDLDIEPTTDPVSEEDALAWLADLMGETTVEEAEPAVTPEDAPAEVVAEAPVDAPVDEPVDEASRSVGDDDALAWLEALTGDAAADEPEAELPPTRILDPAAAVDDETEAAADQEAPAVEIPQVEVGGQIVSDLDLEPTADPLAEEDAMAWLQEVMGEAEAAEAVEAASEAVDAAVDEPQPAALDADAVPEALAAAADETPVDADALAWLEGLVEDDAPREDADDAASLDVGPDDETLTGAPALRPEDIRAAAAAAAGDDLDWLTAGEEPESAPLAAAGETDVDEGADAALAMLDDILGDADLDQEADAVVAEMSVTADEPPAAELEDLAGEIPEDPDEAVAWISTMSSGDSEDEVSEEDELGWLADLAAAPGPDDEQARRMTLDEFQAVEGEVPAFVDEETAAADDGAPDLDDEMVITPEPAAVLDEAADEDLVDTPEPAAVLDEVADEDLVDMPEPAAVLDEAADEDVFDAPEPADDDVSVDDLLPQEDELEEDLAFSESAVMDALPDWLTEGAADEGEISWLDAIPESGVTQWLTAEEEASIQSQVESFESQSALELSDTGEIRKPDTGPLPAMPEPAAEEVAEPEAPAMPAAEHTALVTRLEELLLADDGPAQVIAELEDDPALAQTPQLVQVLGDAYMRTGRLQNALDTYRRALDMM